MISGMRPVLVLMVLSSIAVADPALPIDVVTKAKPGDWAIYEAEQDVGKGPVKDRIVARIAASPTGGNRVVWYRGTKDAEAYFYNYTPDAGKGPDPRMLEKYEAKDMKFSPAKCKLATEISCMKITFKHQITQFTTMTMAAQVRATGVVDVESHSGASFIKMKLVGYGQADKTEWGVGPTKATLADPGAGFGPGVGNGYSGPPNRTPPAPTARIGVPTATGGDLDKAIIRRYIKRNIQKIQYCYERELLSKPKLAGTLTVSFTIGGDGLVPKSTAKGVDPTVATCVAGVIKGIEFPRPKDGKALEVNYPFTFAYAP
jgi:hypothetical protein